MTDTEQSAASLQSGNQQQQEEQGLSVPSRTVHCCDAISWLQQQPALEGCCIITSLPDVSELHGNSSQSSVTQWKAWFINTAKLVLSRCPDDGAVIFFQTDIKVDGIWIDKAYLVQKAAEETGHALLWHKLICRGPPGTATFGKPGYHHMLCFSKGLRLPPAQSTPDVLPAAGDKTWARGMGAAACAAACSFILKFTQYRTIVDPFCGQGTVLAVSNAMGLSAIGVEISAKRARQARQLQVEPHTMGGKCSAGASGPQLARQYRRPPGQRATAG